MSKRVKVTRKMKEAQTPLTGEQLNQALKDDNIDPYTESFESPESSNIVGAKYDVAEQVCLITFRGKGGSPDRIYKYADFPYDLWVNFKGAESKGKFSNSLITPNFEGQLQK